MAGQRYSWTKEKQEALIKNFEKGLSYRELAEKFGFTVASVRSRLYEIRKQGLVSKRRRGKGFRSN
jgi:DNA-directed RNA polymerase specialized sigma24 family protein